jgi:SAM-dependent methyltransferase
MSTWISGPFNVFPLPGCCTVDTEALWDQVYSKKRDDELSWSQKEPRLSLALISEAYPAPARVLDVGGGTSPLAGRLLDAGYIVTVLDVSAAALTRAREHLGERNAAVQLVRADVTANPEIGEQDVWHDRAVFHFLTEPANRRAYTELLARTLRHGGHAIIATFALDGPERCSGLSVQRYDARSLATELGNTFALVRSATEIHTTPQGKPQPFIYGLFRRK